MAVDRLSLLVAARDQLVQALTTEAACKGCGAAVELPGDGLAGISRELRAVLVEIDSIPGSGERTNLDDIAEGIQDDLARQRAKHASAG